MNINHNQLMDAFSSYLYAHDCGSISNCPTKDILLSFFCHRASRRVKNRIVDHLFKCHSCLEEFKFILEIKRSEKRFLLQMKFQPGKTRNALWVHKKKGFLPIWNYAAFAAGFLCLALAIISLLPRNFFNQWDPIHYRSLDLKEIKLVFPIAPVYPESSLRFRWRQPAAYTSSSIDLYDHQFNHIWESPFLQSSDLPFPEILLNSLRAGEDYYWMVTSLTEDGKSYESGIAKFRLIGPLPKKQE